MKRKKNRPSRFEKAIRYLEKNPSIVTGAPQIINSTICLYVAQAILAGDLLPNQLLA